MDNNVEINSDELTQKVEAFASKLDAVERIIDEHITIHKSMLIDLLLSRTDIEHLLAGYCDQYQMPDSSWQQINQLDQLDSRLKVIGTVIAQYVDLTTWQSRADIKEEYWWWFFEPPVSRWDQYDWVWTGLTLVALALSASFVFGIYSALSIGSGSQVFTTFSTVLQGLGLALIGGGALSTIGRNKVRAILTFLNVSPRFHAEALLLISLLFLLSMFGLHHYLDDFYFEKGQKLYAEGELSHAAEAYQRTLAINPDNDQVNGELGRIYESLGDLEKAVQYYMASVNDGNYDHLSDLGRAYINRLNPISRKPDIELAKGYLLIGLQRAEDELQALNEILNIKSTQVVISKQDKENLKKKFAHYNWSIEYPTDVLKARLLKVYDLLYQYHKNIGWAMLSREQDINYSAAQTELLKAVDYENQAVNLYREQNKQRKPNGLAYCMLAYIEETAGEKTASEVLWNDCICNATPEYIHSFKWFFQKGEGDIAYLVDSSYIVSGMSKNHYSFYPHCQPQDNIEQTIIDPANTIQSTVN